MSVRTDGRVTYRGVERDSFKAAATRKGNVYLSECEGSSGVNYYTVECQSLTLVDSYRPGDLKGYLSEFSEDAWHDFSGLFVKSILDILPFHRSYSDHVPFIVGNHDDTFVVNLFNLADLAVIVFSFRIVPYEHDLCADLQ